MRNGINYTQGGACLMEIKSVGMGYGGAGNISDAPSVTQVEKPESPEVVAAQAAGSGLGQDQQTKVSATGSEEGKGKKDKEASDDQIRQAINEINKKAVESEAVFGIHEKTNRVTIKIVDKKTKDVIKEIPAEKTLDLIAKAWEMAGLLVDEKR